MASPDLSPKVQLTELPVVEMEIVGGLPSSEAETDDCRHDDTEMTDSADDTTQLADDESMSDTHIIRQAATHRGDCVIFMTANRLHR